MATGNKENSNYRTTNTASIIKENIHAYLLIEDNCTPTPSDITESQRKLPPHP
ncbi:uncharacterized protein SPAPADRAFT_59518 [Spathaspora passalidarum NRRL Y-27907]|uniref:Uncharacterized protein n=1 Tax=Spathaspora passalidarum (strain NRRL Y-27907 / 11-Y1) TaxID=619300 RepID=G3AHD2_SPAPN|nr:uncharacterized protein SPAPADRAFT_59518 [Spathaspora passalidarum NRRL Y-27907]EGW34096.1 hypothetical protein SPAPADRAFT_59518 [Spathaspora passalidarum NRRL Y-27907]